MELQKIVYEAGEGELIEKKSKFIAAVFPIQSEEEAVMLIEQQKKKYWDARHNCFSYVFGEKNEIQRYSDDGEPSGTAGRPILDVILGQQIHNILIVVTRYFGGTLLGTGGLIRAYSGAAIKGIENSTIVEKGLGKKICMEIEYHEIGKIQHIASQMEVFILDTQYTDIVKNIMLIPVEKMNAFEKEIIEATAGKAKIEEMEDIYYSQVAGKVVLF